MTRPDVSVLLLVRDGERFLGEAVESILGQTLEALELIVVDDGSSDRTRQVLERFDDPRLRLVVQPRLGLVAALNRAAHEAQAGYLARMDADDVSLPDRLDRQLAYLHDRPRAGFAATWVAVIDEQGDERRRDVLPESDVDLRRLLLLRNPFQHGSVLLRREALDEAGGYREDYGHNEDYDLWRRIAPRRELACVPEILYRYRVHGAAVTRTDAERIAHRERLRDELWSAFDARRYDVRGAVRRARGAEPAVRRRLAADHRALAREAFRRRRPAVAARALAVAAALSRG